MPEPDLIRKLAIDLSDAEDKFRLFETIRTPDHKLVPITRKHLNEAATGSEGKRRESLTKALNNIRSLEALLPHLYRVDRTAARA